MQRLITINKITIIVINIIITTFTSSFPGQWNQDNDTLISCYLAAIHYLNKGKMPEIHCVNKVVFRTLKKTSDLSQSSLSVLQPPYPGALSDPPQPESSWEDWIWRIAEAKVEMV